MHASDLPDFWAQRLRRRTSGWFIEAADNGLLAHGNYARERRRFKRCPPGELAFVPTDADIIEYAGCDRYEGASRSGDPRPTSWLRVAAVRSGSSDDEPYSAAGRALVHCGHRRET